MAIQNETAALAGAADSDGAFPGGSCSTELTPKADRIQAKSLSRIDRAGLEQARNLLHESLGFARLYAEVAQMLAEVGDDTGTIHALAQFHAAATATCQTGRLIREGRS